MCYRAEVSLIDWETDPPSETHYGTECYASSAHAIGDVLTQVSTGSGVPGGEWTCLGQSQGYWTAISCYGIEHPGAVPVFVVQDDASPIPWSGLVPQYVPAIPELGISAFAPSVPRVGGKNMQCVVVDTNGALVLQDPQPADISSCAMVVLSGSEAVGNPFALSAEDGAAVGVAIIGVWAVAFAIRAVIQPLKGIEHESSEAHA